MLQNYLTIALRNFWRNKLYTSLNAGGLAIGLAACLLMVLYVDHEFSYDRFHTKASRIVRVTSVMKTPESSIAIASDPLLLAPTLKREYPEVETAVRFRMTGGTVKTKDKLVNQDDVYYADSDVFSVFDYPFVVGNPATALVNPNSVVVTEKFAHKYFGKTDILGQSVEINKSIYQVTGVMANLPSNTDLPISALLSQKQYDPTDWLADDFPAYTYILFRKEPNLSAFSKKLAQLSNRYLAPALKKAGAEKYAITFRVEPLTDVHYSQGNIEDTPKGNRQFSYLFAFLAAFVLVIALLNYINLLTARATERAKEVGIRKATGAQYGQLVRQFLFESLLLSGLSIGGALGLLQLTIPLFNNQLSIQMHFGWAEAIAVVACTWLLVTLLGGLYPAFVLSGYRPVDVLKGKLAHYGQGLWLRKSIIVFQFVLAVSMIAGVLVIQRQMHYLQHYDVGYTREQILSLYLPDDSTARAGAPAFANSLKQHSEVEGITLGFGLANGPMAMSSTTIRSNGKKREVMSNYLFIDDKFVPLLQIPIQAGRNLSSQYKTDLNGGFLVNEAFVKMAGWKQGEGQAISGFGHKGTVVGVLKNFNYRSLHNPVEPLVLIYCTVPAINVMARIRPSALPTIQAIWQQHYPGYPFEYSFLDTSFDAEYRKDRLMTMIFNCFAGLTILVSCLGLFGLVAFTTERRTKEIGVRKVLGASISNVVALLSKDFLKLVLVAILIASPIAWWATNQWLQAFAYKTDVSWWVFALAGVLVIVIALLTISYQSIKAALMNPVKSLRSE